MIATTSSENTNGKPRVGPLDWRPEAMLEALAVHDTRAALIFRRVLQQSPHQAMLLMRCEHDRLIETVEKHHCAKSLLPFRARWLAPTDDEACPSDAAPDRTSHNYLHWLEVPWRGATIELILLPGISLEDAVVCVGPSDEILSEFADKITLELEEPPGRVLCYSAGWRAAPELEAALSEITWDDIVLESEIMRGIRAAIEDFFQNRDVYRAFGFAWRRGILFVGPPGTGKTMLCKAAAASLPDLPFLYVRDLQDDYSGSAIRKIFQQARLMAPCILVFEDLDGLLSDYVRAEFLNEMDGFANNDGLLILASSNHPERIDEALLKRPSRFDRLFHIGVPKEEERKEYCRRLLSRSSLADKISATIEHEALSARIAAKTDGFTPAYLKEAFTAAAMQRAQVGALVLDELFVEAMDEQVELLRLHLKHADRPEQLREIKSHRFEVGLRQRQRR